MELNFTKVGNGYVAEFEASGSFNVHIETEEACGIAVMQRTSKSGSFAPVEVGGAQSYGKVIDVDFSAVVWPKTIQIHVPYQPTKAEVNTNA